MLYQTSFYSDIWRYQMAVFYGTPNRIRQCYQISMSKYQKVCIFTSYQSKLYIKLLLLKQPIYAMILFKAPFIA